jgi:lysophospholipase L1-like esterase
MTPMHGSVPPVLALAALAATLAGCLATTKGDSGPSSSDHDANADAGVDAMTADAGSDLSTTPGSDAGPDSGPLPDSDAGFEASSNPDSEAPSTGGSDASAGPDAKSDAAPEAGSDSGSVAHTGVWRIMPLGDSITGTMCPPQLLSQQLIQNGHTDFVFVGSNLNNQSCYGAPNVQTEGHGGYLVTDLVGDGIHASQLPEWCAADKADIVLMQFGTNDVWNSKSAASILAAYSVVLKDLRAVNPKVIMFVAQITPLNPAGCTSCEAGVVALNAQIPGWASGQSTTTSPVYVVDVFSAFDPAAYLPSSTYTVDGVHPDPAGSKLDADKWYDAVTAQSLP